MLGFIHKLLDRLGRLLHDNLGCSAPSTYCWDLRPRCQLPHLPWIRLPQVDLLPVLVFEVLQLRYRIVRMQDLRETIPLAG